jgi:hypothetical protein
MSASAALSMSEALSNRHDRLFHQTGRKRCPGGADGGSPSGTTLIYLTHKKLLLKLNSFSKRSAGRSENPREKRKQDAAKRG